jgi:phage portal protein BeeE
MSTRPRLLLNRPGPGATACDLFGSAMAHLLVNGNCFVGKFGSDAEIVQLGLLDPRQVEVELRGHRIVYTVTTHGPVSGQPSGVLMMMSGPYKS